MATLPDFQKSKFKKNHWKVWILELEVVMPQFTTPYQHEIVFFLILESRFCLKDTSLSHSDT